VTSPARTADDELLDTLALEHGPAEIPFAAAVLTCAGLSAEEMADAWTIFAEALAKHHALQSREQDWSVHYDEEDLPPGASPQEAAIEMAAEEAHYARLALKNGTGRTQTPARSAT
jgi:hypothetical protein